MKKNISFILVVLIILSTSLVFADNITREVTSNKHNGLQTFRETNSEGLICDVYHIYNIDLHINAIKSYGQHIEGYSKENEETLQSYYKALEKYKQESGKNELEFYWGVEFNNKGEIVFNREKKFYREPENQDFNWEITDKGVYEFDDELKMAEFVINEFISPRFTLEEGQTVVVDKNIGRITREFAENGESISTFQEHLSNSYIGSRDFKAGTTTKVTSMGMGSPAPIMYRAEINPSQTLYKEHPLSYIIFLKTVFSGKGMEFTNLPKENQNYDTKAEENSYKFRIQHEYHAGWFNMDANKYEEDNLTEEITIVYNPNKSTTVPVIPEVTDIIVSITSLIPELVDDPSPEESDKPNIPNKPDKPEDPNKPDKPNNPIPPIVPTVTVPPMVILFFYLSNKKVKIFADSEEEKRFLTKKPYKLISNGILVDIVEELELKNEEETIEVEIPISLVNKLSNSKNDEESEEDINEDKYLILTIDKDKDIDPVKILILEEYLSEDEKFYIVPVKL